MSDTDKPFRFEGEENFISGIYNYCDRWCERCSFTLRCEVFARDNEGPDDPESHDINNAKFWHKLEGIFQEAREMISQLAEEHGVDLKELETNEAIALHKQQLDDAENHELARAAKTYAERVSEWFQEQNAVAEFDDQRPQASVLEDSEEVREATEVIFWYQFQIAVKIIRGLMGAEDEEGSEQEADEAFPKDSDGSMKVALIAIDRSIGAWRIMQIQFPEKSASIVALLIALDGLRQGIERLFPGARSFVRPGFDEIPDDLIN
jgi:hypothetical protein